jgi:hypothetical protein
MTKIIVFPLTLRAPPGGRSQPTAAASAAIPFPYGRRRNLVERHARAMRALSSDEASEYLTTVLEQVCEDLEKIGIDCNDCQSDAIHEFAEAIGRQLHGPEFRLEPEEAAQ